MKGRLFHRALAALLSLTLIVSFLPATVFAAENNPTSLIVGNVVVDTTQGGYWTTDDSGVLTASDESNYNVYYDANGTLYLNNATISGVSTTNYGAGIWFKGGDLVIIWKEITRLMHLRTTATRREFLIRMISNMDLL